MSGSNFQSGLELLYSGQELHFTGIARSVVAKGWSVFPQERDSGRMPGKVFGEVIKWQADHKLQYRLPTQESLELWENQCGNLNVALVFGPASGNTFAIDIDVMNAEMSEDIQNMAEEFLGYTQFRRVGMAPKMALIYRHGPNPEDVVPSTSRRFAVIDENGNAVQSEDGLEILGAGKLITIYGLHHKTGNYFTWEDVDPLLASPDAAPLVTPERVAAFMEAVDARYRFIRRPSLGGWKWDEDLEGKVSRVLTTSGGAPWDDNGGAGKVTDGREAYLSHLAFTTAGDHGADIHQVSEENLPALTDQLCKLVYQKFVATAETTGRWELGRLQQEVSGKVGRLVRKIRDNELKAPKSGQQGPVSSFRSPTASPASVKPRQKSKPMSLPDLLGQGSQNHAGLATPSKEQKAPAVPAGRRLPVSDHNPEADDGGQAEEARSTIQLPEGAGLQTSDSEGEFAYLPQHLARRFLDGRVEPPHEEDLEIKADRASIASGIHGAIIRAYTEFFNDVYSEHPRGGVDILLAPPGAGKTSQFIRFVASDPRTYRPFTPAKNRLRAMADGPVVEEDGEDVEGGAAGATQKGNSPIVALLPTYANIDELRSRAANLNLDPALSDAELRRAAAELGLIAENELDGRLADLRRDALNCAELSRQVSGDPRGLVTMVYSGKIKAGCQMADKVTLAMEAGVGSGAFCRAVVKSEKGDSEEKFCPYYEGCPAIAQRQNFANAHVVFMPHPFLSLSLPEELMDARCIVADERIHHMFLHSLTFSVMSLDLARKPPRLTKQEKRLGVEATDLLADREKVAKLAMAALTDRRCPAQVIYEHSSNPNSAGILERLGGLEGKRLVSSALRVCGSAIQRDGQLTPDMSLPEVRDYCARPTGRDVREEWRFWKIIEERIDALAHDAKLDWRIRTIQQKLVGLENDDPALEFKRQMLRGRLHALQGVKRQAKGERDMRIQLYDDTKTNDHSSQRVRLSWRTQPNWLGIPMLLLDASAAPAIVAKVWGLQEHEVRVHRVVDDFGKSLNTRIVAVVNQTFANSSIASSPDATTDERWKAAQNLAKVRDAISTVAGLYGDGRIVAGTSILLREVIARGWRSPDHVDWCHFGAMRGLDMFKNHAAAISIGRMEVPVRGIDGLVAALSYDDDEPELPFDLLGTGKDQQGKDIRLPMGEQRIRMRSGHTVVTKVPMFPGHWGRLLQAQYREEELIQFLGRLRPVHRTGRTPVWFCLSSIVPEGLIVDDVIHIDDLATGGKKGAGVGLSPLWEAERRLDGILDVALASECCGDLLLSEKRAAELLLQSGFNPETGDKAGRIFRGHGVLRWRWNRSEDWRFCLAKGVMGPDEAIRRLRANLQRFFGEDEDAFHVEAEVVGGFPVAEGNLMALARPRSPDTVDARIGSLEARRMAEDELDSTAGEALLDMPRHQTVLDTSSGGATRTKVINYYYGKNGEKVKSYNSLELRALFALDGYWRDKASSADDSLLPVVSEVGPESENDGEEVFTYEHFGSFIADKAEVGDTPSWKRLRPSMGKVSDAA